MATYDLLRHHVSSPSTLHYLLTQRGRTRHYGFVKQLKVPRKNSKLTKHESYGTTCVNEHVKGLSIVLFTLQYMEPNVEMCINM